MRLTIDTSNLSHASAASALAHANRKPVEIWHPPARQPAAEKAALCVKDFTPPQQPKPTTQHSAEGLGAALLAVREQNKASPKAPQPTHTRAISTGRYHHTAVGGHPKEKALQAATDAYSTSRKRADSVPSDQGIASDAPYARSAAGASQNVRHVEQDGPLDHLNSTMEASRIHHIANTNAKLYTSAPPVQAEIEEQNYKNSLRAAAISMAKDMYKVSDNKGSGVSDPALLAAQKGQSQLGYRKTVSTADGSAVRRAIALQEAAQKRAAEKLARMHDEHAEYQQYYGTAPQPQRSRLSRRKRTSSDADASQIDAEQSRQIRSQMTSLRTKLDQVDVRRTKDRELLMQAARRNVDQTLQDMEARVYANTGRAPPSVQREWDEVAQERVRREAEAFEAATVQGDRVKIGSQQYMDYADVEAVARSRLQPALDEITENAEQQRAHDIEERLDAEERQRHAAVLRQREAEVRELEKQDKSQFPAQLATILNNTFSRILHIQARTSPRARSLSPNSSCGEKRASAPASSNLRPTKLMPFHPSPKNLQRSSLKPQLQKSQLLKPTYQKTSYRRKPATQRQQARPFPSRSCPPPLPPPWPNHKTRPEFQPRRSKRPPKSPPTSQRTISHLPSRAANLHPCTPNATQPPQAPQRSTTSLHQSPAPAQTPS
jgi:hypothetical protein